MKKIFFIFLVSVSVLFAKFTSIPYEKIQSLGKDVVIIDIRTKGEWDQTGVIPGSKKITFFDERGNYDVKKWLDEFSKYVKDKNQPFVLVCRSGNRTKMVGQFLDQQLGYKNVYDLDGGIVYGYINKGYKTEGKKSGGFLRGLFN